MGNSAQVAPAKDEWSVVSTQPIAPASQAAQGNEWQPVGELPVEKFQAAEQAKPGFFQGAYNFTIGQLVSMAGELADYYKNKSSLEKLLIAIGGPVALQADMVIDPDHPLRKLQRGLIAAHIEQGKETIESGREAVGAGVSAIESLAEGDTQAAKVKRDEAYSAALETIGHGLATVVPAVGPAAAQAAEDIVENPRYGLGEATGLIGSVLAPRILGKTAELAKKVTRTATDAQKLTAAVSPTGVAASKNFLQTAERALPELRSVANGLSSPSNLGGLIRVAEEAGKQLEAKFQAVIEPVRDVTVDTTAIAEAMEGKISNYVASKYPEVAKQIKKDAAFYRDSKMTVADLDDFRKGLNDELNTYYAKNNIKRLDAAKDPQIGYRVAEADALRELEYKTISDASGQDVRALKKLQSDLTDIRESAQVNLNKLTVRDAKLRGRTLTSKFWDAAQEAISTHPLRGVRALARIVLQRGSPELKMANEAAAAALKTEKPSVVLPAAKALGATPAILAGAEEEK